MKTFKQHLAEAPVDAWDVSWKKTYIDHIFFSSRYFYLPPKLIKTLLGTVELEAFHATTMNGLRQLKAIQHTRKTISTFTMHNELSDLFYNVISGDYKEDTRTYDVVVRLKGELVAGYQSDIMSQPDEKGTRGSSVGNILYNYQYGKLKEQFLEDMMLELGTKYKEFADRFFIDFGGKPQHTYRDLQEMKVNYRTNKYVVKTVNSIFYAIQFKFYNFMKECILEHKDEIKYVFYRPESFHSTHSVYNEVLVNNFTILDMYLMCYSKDRIPIVIDGLTRLNMINKVVNFDEWIEMSKHFKTNPRFDDAHFDYTIVDHLDDYIKGNL
jgi:hypothetical protein